MLSLAYGICLRLFALDSVIINEWVTRDFDRAFNLWRGDYIPLAGPDLTNGGRLPGPFLYFFLIPPLFIKPSYEILFNFNFALNIISIFTVFFISKRYFGYKFSVIATSLVSLDLHHIGAVHFPINPTFIIFFLTLYVGILFEFAIKRKEKNLPLMVLIICLSIQIHYQIAAYILTPIILAIIFKIKISKKSVFLSMIIGVLCFLPYGVYKLKTFPIKQNSDIGVFSFIQKENFFINILKSVFIQNTIKRLYNTSPGQRGISKFVNTQKLPSYTGDIIKLKQFSVKFYSDADIRFLSRIAFSCAFYYLLFYIGFKSYRNGKEKYINEISIIIIFLTPAYIYEIIKPFEFHYWYNYIFILPKSYIITCVINLLLTINRTNKFKIASTLCLIFLFTNLFLHSIQAVSRDFNYFKGHLNNVSNTTANLTTSYRDSKLLLNTMMKDLQLKPEEYYNRVYFLDFNPSSFKRIQLASDKLIEIYPRTQLSVLDMCFFIIDPTTFIKSRKTSNTRDNNPKLKIFNAFMNDSTINIYDTHEISFVKLGFLKIFTVYRYIPKYNQSCYRNSHNPFIVSKNTKSILEEARGLKSSTLTSKPNFTQISIHNKYDLNGVLLFWQGKYIILDPISKTPFRLTVTILKENNNYSVKGTVDSFFNIGQSTSNFDNLSILIKSNEYIFNDFKAAIFNKNSLITSRGLNSTNLYGIQNYNKHWFKESSWDSKTELTENNFYIDVEWGMYKDGFIKNNSLRIKTISTINSDQYIKKY